MSITRPMLAETLDDPSTLKYPLLGSPKLDGIRCLRINRTALARSFKPVVNHYVRNWLITHCPDGLDGELMIKSSSDLLIGQSFNDTQSKIMTESGTPDFFYAVFDYLENDSAPYCQRYGELVKFVKGLPPEVASRIKLVEHQLIETPEQLSVFETNMVDLGYEGAMIRSVDGPYKNGRSTKRQGYLLKMKRFVDTEGVVIGFEEMMHNENEQTVNELGLLKRSKEKAGMVPAGMLGKFLVRASGFEDIVKVGGGEGLTHELKKEIWENQSKYLGKIVRFRYQQYGMKNKPRIATWTGFRDERDTEVTKQKGLDRWM